MAALRPSNITVEMEDSASSPPTPTPSSTSGSSSTTRVRFAGDVVVFSGIGGSTSKSTKKVRGDVPETTPSGGSAFTSPIGGYTSPKQVRVCKLNEKDKLALYLVRPDLDISSKTQQLLSTFVDFKIASKINTKKVMLCSVCDFRWDFLFKDPFDMDKQTKHTVAMYHSKRKTKKHRLGAKVICFDQTLVFEDEKEDQYPNVTRGEGLYQWTHEEDGRLHDICVFREGGPKNYTLKVDGVDFYDLNFPDDDEDDM